MRISPKVRSLPFQEGEQEWTLVNVTAIDSPDLLYVVPVEVAQE